MLRVITTLEILRNPIYEEAGGKEIAFNKQTLQTEPSSEWAAICFNQLGWRERYIERKWER